MQTRYGAGGLRWDAPRQGLGCQRQNNAYCAIRIHYSRYVQFADVTCGGGLTWSHKEPTMADAEPGRRLTLEECLAKAQECRDMARQAIRTEHRAVLDQMAETWARIAADMNRTNSGSSR
jgi:hypothetical protein